MSNKKGKDKVSQEEKGLIKLPQVEAIEEVMVSSCQVALVDSSTGRRVELTSDPVVDNETGKVIGWLFPGAKPLRFEW